MTVDLKKRSERSLHTFFALFMTAGTEMSAITSNGLDLHYFQREKNFNISL